MQKKQIGQLFIVGYMGEEPSDEFLAFVDEWGIGGVIVFARNLTDPDKLPGHLQKIAAASGQKVFTAIDQEGGLVLRILSKGSLFPSAMAMAATGSTARTEAIHYAMGKEMLSLGLNWNLAPVLDINHPDNPGIGARSFGDTPEQVALHGCAAIKGLQSAGVLACAKHFPGKGHAQVDSHLTLPVIPHPADRLESFELYPFKKAIEAEVAAIMTAHVFFPAFEPEKDRPATLSKSVLTGLLRHKLGFNGILVTDDLEMGAITEKYGIAQAASLSFHAGADLLLICHRLDQQRQAAETLLAQLKSNTETGRRLNESLERITAARRVLNVAQAPQPLQQLHQSHAPLLSDVHDESIKFLRFSKDMLPLPVSGNHTLFVLPQISSLVQVEEEHRQGSLKAQVCHEFPEAVTTVYEPKCSADELTSSISATIPNLDASNRVVFFTYNAHIFKDQLAAIEALRKKTSHIAVVALRNPFDLAGCTGIATCAATFGFRSPAVSALLKVFKGVSAPDTANWPISTAGW